MNKKKNNNLFFQLLGISFLIFLALYIAELSGYYESQGTKKSVITQEKLEEFEEDVASGKEINIKDYITKEYVDYSSPVSRMGNKISNGLDKFMDGGVSDFFKVIGNLFK